MFRVKSDPAICKKVSFPYSCSCPIQPSPHFVNVEKVCQLQKGYFISLDLQAAREYTFNFDESGGGLGHSGPQFLKGYFFLQIPGPRKNTKWRAQQHLRKHAETKKGCRVKARDALQILQRRQRPLSFKVIELNDFNSQWSLASLRYLQGVSGLDSKPDRRLCDIYKASLASSPETPCKTRRNRKRA